MGGSHKKNKKKQNLSSINQLGEISLETINLSILKVKLLLFC